MDRYNEVKTQLKNWEQSFVQQNQRKPNKEDIDKAPEDTKNLYKEYRSLKQAKEGSVSANGAKGHVEKHRSTEETSITQKDSGCWGTHLNRSKLPVPSPGLTSQDREGLKASAQYYGMKLKNNLATLSKERPISLKKSLTPGCTPLKSWKEKQNGQTNETAADTNAQPCTPTLTVSSLALCSPFTPRRASTCPGSQATQFVCPAEPEEPFEPFQPTLMSCDEPCSAAKNKNDIKSDNDGSVRISSHHASNLALSPATPLVLVPTVSPPGSEGTSRGGIGTSAKLNESVGGSGDTVGDCEALDALKGDAGSVPGVGVRALAGFGGGKGGVVVTGRSPLVSRLSLVDRGWLERCQVFGEVEEGEKPGAGNQVIKLHTGGGGERGGDKGAEGEELEGIMGANGKGKVGKKEVGTAEGERGEVGMGRGGGLKTFSSDRAVSDMTRKPAAHLTRKSRRGGEEMEVEKGRVEDVETRLCNVPEEEESAVWLETKTPKRRGKKRQREGEDNEGGTTEKEGGARKRQKKGGKKVAGSDENTTAQGVGKKRRRAKTDEGTKEEVKQTKEPEKVPQENLFGELDEDMKVNKAQYTASARGRYTKNSDGNFVKINLKKKSHVKGYALRGAGLRKQMYMQKFQLKGERFGGGGGLFGRGRRGGFRGGFNRLGDTCYKCGGTGHWAIDCKGRAPPPPVTEDQPAVDELFELPTLEEVARATGTLQPQPLVASPSGKEEQQHREEKGEDKHGGEMLLNVIRPDYERPEPPPPMEPLYSLREDGKVQAMPAEVFAALRDFGYQSFRPGQEEAIMRILSGLSTLVVLSTGMGKSLCYQLPAYLYAQRSKSITLVISPLVSLMDDQLSGLPAKLKAACIHSNMTMKQREAAIEKVKSGEVCVLLLSPEALVGGGGSGSGCLPPAEQLPPVAFACIDEAHCVSEWSHNFRPCYLRLCKVLRERLGVRCLLGLTATATLSTALDIARHLDIRDQDGISVRSAAVPPNLQLSVSMDREKDQALVSLLKGDRFGCLDSIIVYCTRREETARVAALLRTCLQGVVLRENSHSNTSGKTQSNPVGQKKKEMARKKIRKPLKWQAESYHAGLSASERRRVQNNFMCGELRVVVATVAFGMGLDKSDVRGIVHYNMPKSFESYVQEIGRAGRDGDPAHCHLFLDPEGGDLHELRRHIYSDTVDYYTVKRLVQKVFPPCKCRQIHQKQQDLAKYAEDIGDAELLEMMDSCDQNTPTQQDMVKSISPGQHRDVPSPPPAVLPSPPQAEDGPLQQKGDEREEGEKEEDETERATKHQDVEAAEANDSLRDQKVELMESNDWPRERVCHTHERAIPIQETVEALDITEEGVETLLCYLELHLQRFVELLHPTLSVCKISCYDGPRQLRKITKICPPVAVVLARKRMAGERIETCSSVEFDVVEVADTMGWQLPLVKRGLRQLQWSTERAGDRSGVIVEFSSPSFYFRSYGDLNDEEMDRVCQFLHKRVQEQEGTQLYQLNACFKSFKSVAFRSVSSCVDDLDESRSLQLKTLLAQYFDKRRDRDHTHTQEDEEDLNKYKLLDWEDQIRADMRSFLAIRSDEKFSGRAIARIFHGIGSPCYPAQTYGRDRRYWRKYIHFDFNQLIRMATQEIINFK
ncbi:ATP-dependent DNA helicase Q4 [Lampris incognitus]|uniref:ATP-dependent DNA helicase Q4 n=1 Tax=Lampris incognitus TaxID=2546036 RepID=UPI0024B5D85F|nr:ATP-dependent DNA helicase Q4 [Lampris incognitus]